MFFCRQYSGGGYVGWAIYFLAVLLFLACFGGYIAHLPTSYDLFPPLIPYSGGSHDVENMNYVGPFGKQQVASVYYRHWLGTDLIGRDVAAGMIVGCRTVLLVGFGSTGIALVIGVLVGLLAGYWGTRGVSVSVFSLVFFWDWVCDF